MKKLYLTLTMITFAGSLMYSQSLEWAKQMSGTSEESGSAICIDASGNIYTMGYFYETVDFDPSAATFNLTSNGLADIFVTKLDAQGNFLWAKQIGGTFFDTQGTIIVDSNGDIILGGNFRGAADLDPGSGTLHVTVQGTAAFLMKLDTNGDLIWVKHWGGNNSSADVRVYDIVLDDSSHIFIGGSFSGVVDFDPSAGTYNVAASGSGDGFISKLDANGNFSWAVTVNGNNTNNSDAVRALGVDGLGNVVASGSFFGSASNFNLQNGGNFYIKLDAAGAMLWTKQTDGIHGAQTNSLKVDDSGNIYMVGRFSETRDFDPGPGVFNLTNGGGSYDIFILKLNMSGNFVWAKSFGGSSFTGWADNGNGIALDSSGNIYTTGSYISAGDFDPGAGTFILPQVGFVDMFVLKLDGDGNFINALTFGAPFPTVPYFVRGTSVVTGADEKVYLTGSFYETTDFDPGLGVFNLTAQGITDIFVLKLDGVTLGVEVNSLTKNISLYPNPTKGNITIDLGKEYTDVIVQTTDILGKVISIASYSSAKTIEKEITGQAGIYFVNIRTAAGATKTIKILKN